MQFTPPFETWVKRRRIQLDLTRPLLGRKMGYAPETLRKLESGRLKPSAQMAALLAKHLAIPEAQRDEFFAFAMSQTNGSGDAGAFLPIFSTPLIGRETELAAVIDLLQRADVRLVTLTGAPGVGKTRLAVEVARGLRECFAGGAPFIDLAAATQPHTALSKIVQSLDLDADSSVPLLNTLQDGLRDKQLLLVLDNLEQVLALGPLLGQVLSAAPRVKMLATSREALNISIEQIYVLAPLAQCSHDAADWHSPAVELFAQRARVVAPAFALNDANGATIAAICRRLDGLPLAIELAAARTTIFTPAEILNRLEQRLPLPAAATRDLPERHRTLSATLDWSHALLSVDEQTLFRRLGVFAGGFALGAVEFLGDADEPALDAEGALAALVAKNLLAHNESAGGESRYAMLETIHAYALDQLRAHGEWDIWHERLAEYLLALVAQVHFRRALPADAENWRAAVAWAISSGRMEDAALPLLQAFNELGITHRERITWLQQALAHPRIVIQPATHAGILSLLGQSCHMVDDFTQAQRRLAEGLAICKHHTLHTEAIDILFAQGLISRCLGET